MDSITLTFPQPLNVSIQKGDTAYYTNDINGNAIVQIGIVTNVLSNSIDVDIPTNVVRPLLTSFILFSKTNEANQSNLKGYYLEATFINDSANKAELFSVGSEIFVSSK
ncbi:MAG: hypothetical protein ACKVJK_04070 [Methylophagaceae bacterium]|tara:strand:+ start:416 stop:742 length:327 start_codon:yes stop_codon:yes gene_type:complete